MDFDDFCSFFECHFILAEKQRTKQTIYSSLSLSTSLDTQDTFQGGIIVEWKNFWQEIPVCLGRNAWHKSRMHAKTVKPSNSAVFLKMPILLLVAKTKDLLICIK